GARLRGYLRDRRQRLRVVVARLGLRTVAHLTGLTYVALDYPPTADLRPRYGHGRPPQPELAALISAHREAYRGVLASLLSYRSDLRRLEDRVSGGHEPSWINEFLPGLDTVCLYGFVRSRAARHYVEVGSGHSTRVVARA